MVEPTSELHAAWRDAHREWGVGMHEDGFGVLPSDELTSATGFSTWLERLDREENGSAVGLADYRCVYRWIVDVARESAGAGSGVDPVSRRQHKDQTDTRTG